MLTHELNNFTMQEAVNWYSKLKAAFKVWCINLYPVHVRELMSFVIVYRACQRGVEHQPAIRRNQLLTSFIFSMSVIYICSHYRNSILSLTLIPHSDISGQLTATGSASPSSFGRLEWLWLRSKRTCPGHACGQRRPSRRRCRSCGVCWWYSTSNSMSAVYSHGPVLVLHIGYFLIILAISSLSF
jgi:hypothetical protein